MRLAVLLLLLASSLPAATVLPGSYAELDWGGSDFYFVADDGFWVGGGGRDASTLGFAWVGYDQPISATYNDASSDAVIGSASVYGSGNVGPYDGVWFEFTGPDFAVTPGVTEYSSPFTMTGGFQWVPDGEHSETFYFSGSGTVHMTLWHGEDSFSASHVRYEFEAVEDITPAPEGSTWCLLLLGLGAAYWKRR